MIPREQNELLCRVEGAVPMGALMRQHWHDEKFGLKARAVVVKAPIRPAAVPAATVAGRDVA